MVSLDARVPTEVRCEALLAQAEGMVLGGLPERAIPVLETLRRVQDLGAEVAWVGSDQEFYRAIGFVSEFTNELWLRDR